VIGSKFKYWKLHRKIKVNMSPEDTDTKPDGEKDKRLPFPHDSEASKRLGGDPTTEAPAPLLKEDKVINKADIKKDSKDDNKAGKEG